MKKQLFVMVGCPASGKSTVSKQLQEKTGYKLISRDKVRKEIGETSYSKEGHKIVRDAFHDRIRSALFGGHDVIADATHLTKLSRSYLIDLASEYDAEAHAIYFDETWENIKERNSQRGEEEKVPLDVLHNMYLDYQFPSISEGFKTVYKIDLTEKKK